MATGPKVIGGCVLCARRNSRSHSAILRLSDRRSVRVSASASMERRGGAFCFCNLKLIFEPCQRSLTLNPGRLA
jgi:hypothetical protein